MTNHLTYRGDRTEWLGQGFIHPMSGVEFVITAVDFDGERSRLTLERIDPVEETQRQVDAILDGARRMGLEPGGSR